MKKIINPCLGKAFDKKGKLFYGNTFVAIEFDEEKQKLSFFGVIAPQYNGNCFGSCGQCIDDIRQGQPTKEWSEEMLNKLCDIWEEWHLNDMRPYCSHQKELGWDKTAKEKVILYNYILNHETSKKQRNAENAALEALRKGETFTPTDIQTKLANLSYFFTTDKKLTENDDFFTYYRPNDNPTEEKTLGWLTPQKHPRGILEKPCPVCGYKYGSSWKTEKVPEEIIEWLKNLPETKVNPIWKL